MLLYMWGFDVMIAWKLCKFFVRVWFSQPPPYILIKRFIMFFLFGGSRRLRKILARFLSTTGRYRGPPPNIANCIVW